MQPQPPEHPDRPPQAQKQLVRAVLDAYREGWFPMADSAKPHKPAQWLQPETRGVLPLHLPGEPDPSGLALEPFHLPKRLATRLRTARFAATTDRAFARVLRACAQQRESDGGTWIDAEITELFELLHAEGHAHSFEIWHSPDLPPMGYDLQADTTGIDPAAQPPAGAELVGGLYGLRIGSLFCGESMFSRPESGGTDASKAALVRTVGHLRAHGCKLLDTQMTNDHLDQFNCQAVDRTDYLRAIKALTG